MRSTVFLICSALASVLLTSNAIAASFRPGVTVSNNTKGNLYFRVSSGSCRDKLYTMVGHGQAAFQFTPKGAASHDTYIPRRQGRQVGCVLIARNIRSSQSPRFMALGYISVDINWKTKKITPAISHIVSSHTYNIEYSLNYAGTHRSGTTIYYSVTQQ